MAADSSQPLRVELAQVGGFPCLKPLGEVDIASVSTLQEALGRELDAGHTRLIVNLQELAYLDSTGLGCIAAARRRARDAGGDLVLACAQPRILRLLSITGLDQVFTVCRHEAEAAAALGTG
jgi:anti-sigma B factor antagonist